jgi:hypothetical protein
MTNAPTLEIGWKKNDNKQQIVMHFNFEWGHCICMIRFVYRLVIPNLQNIKFSLKAYKVS